MQRSKIGWKIGEDDLELLEYLKDHAVRDAAYKFRPKIAKQNLTLAETQIRGWLHRIRQRVKRFRWYINNLQNLQKISQRVRKLTSDGQVPEQDDDEDAKF